MNNPLLTISILSTTGREQYLTSMILALSRQIEKCEHNVVYQVISDKPANKGGLSVGAKRNIALQAATGTYHAFVDCDDTLWHDYVEKQVKGCLAGLDCVSFHGYYFEDNNLIKPFVHSIIYNKWSENEKFYERGINHLNAVKTSIAKQFPFEEINHGEDYKWSNEIMKSGLLRSEELILGPVYDYYFRSKKEEFK